MIEEYPGFLSLDKLLKEEYGYVYDENNSEEFFSKPFVHLEAGGRTAYAWISYKGEEYLFKPIENFEWNVWGELLSYEIATLLKIPAAPYRACSLGTKKGVITKKIQKKHETLILGSELIQKVFNQHPLVKEQVLKTIPLDFLMQYDNKNTIILNYLNNLNHVKMLLPFFPEIQKKEVEEVSDFLTKLFLFQIITLQGDCNMNNWGFLKGEKIKPAPIFDSSCSFGLGYPDLSKRSIYLREEVMNYRYLRDIVRINNILYQSCPLFTLSSDHIISLVPMRKSSHKQIFESFLEDSSLKYKNLAYTYVKTVSTFEIEKMIKVVEEKNGIRMDPEVFYYICTIMDYHLKNLNDIVKKIEKGSVSYGK